MKPAVTLKKSASAQSGKEKRSSKPRTLAVQVTSRTTAPPTGVVATPMSTARPQQPVSSLTAMLPKNFANLAPVRSSTGGNLSGERRISGRKPLVPRLNLAKLQQGGSAAESITDGGSERRAAATSRLAAKESSSNVTLASINKPTSRLEARKTRQQPQHVLKATTCVAEVEASAGGFGEHSKQAAEITPNLSHPSFRVPAATLSHSAAQSPSSEGDKYYILPLPGEISYRCFLRGVRNIYDTL